MALVQTARRLEGEFRMQGLSLKKDALSLVGEYVAESEDHEEAIAKVIEAVQQMAGVGSVLTKEHVEEALAGLYEGGGGAGEVDPLVVVDAFTMPRLKYNPVLKKFSRHPKVPSIHGEAVSKLDLYRERFQVLHQRVMRNKLFTAPSFEISGQSRDFCELTNVQSLIGLYKVTKYVMGKITQLEDGRYFLEDFSATVPVDLSQAQCTSGLFTENCIVIAEGELRHDNVFQVHALGFPPVEAREASVQAAGGVDFLGAGPVRAGDVARARKGLEGAAGEMFVVLSDVHLDSAQCMESLRTVLEGYSGQAQLPSLFVLMGNFTSNPLNLANSDFAGTRAHFDGLADLLQQFPRVITESRVVLVPGPSDPGPSSALPRPPLPHFFTKRLKEVCPGIVLASNPCRVLFHSQQMVLMRMDLQQRMRRACLLPPDESAGGLFEHLTATLVQQSHLCPLPLTVQPVYWEYDHALSLYPLPDTLVLADRAAQSQCDFEGTLSFNPGSFAKDGSFAAYRPATRECEFSEV